MTAQLFDIPGPRARRRHRITAGVVALVAAGLAWIVLTRLADRGQLTSEKWSPLITADVWREYLIPGLLGTLQAAAGAVVLSGVFGLIFGLGRLSHVKAVRAVSGVVVEFFRAIPVLVMMIFAFWTYSYGRVFPPDQLALAAVITGLTPYNGAVIAELIRSGVGNLPSGQAEAGLSIGLTRFQTLRAIQLPQALTAMLPALVSQLVVVLKDTALGWQITYGELLVQGNRVGTAYANLLPALLLVAVLFIVLNIALTTLAGRLEEYLRRRGHTAGPVSAVPVGAASMPPAGT